MSSEDGGQEEFVPPGADHYELALKFLSNPKLLGLPDERKVEFLAKKGIDRAVVERALHGAKFCPFTKTVYPPGTVRPAASSGGGFFEFLWKLVKLTSGLALSAYLVKKFVWPRLIEFFNEIGKPKATPGHNSASNSANNNNSSSRFAAERRRASPSEIGGSHHNEVLMKKLDNIVTTLQDVVARQEAVSESLALLLKSRQRSGSGTESNSGEVGQVVQQNSDRMLAEIADLKALLVSPNRFPPMPTSSYVPSSGGAKPQVARKTSSSFHSTTSSGVSNNNQESNLAPVEATPCESACNGDAKTNVENSAGNVVRAESA